MDRHPKIAALVKDEQYVMGGDQYWIVMSVVGGTYLAAWVDENGELHTVTRKRLSAALRIASESWGR